MARGHGLTIDIAEKRFDEAEPLFRDLRLAVTPGSVVALHGPSGIGKSTLLRLIAGLDRDFTGTIDLGASAPGFMFQDPRLLPWLTVRDNIRLARPGMPAATANAALTRVGLADRANAWPHALSGGMQRRVALARAFATGAGLLLLDEPFTSLDRALVDDMHALLAIHVAAAGATVVFASHNPEDAARLATRIVTLAGRPVRIVADETVTRP